MSTIYHLPGLRTKPGIILYKPTNSQYFWRISFPTADNVRQSGDSRGGGRLVYKSVRTPLCIRWKGSLRCQLFFFGTFLIRLTQIISTQKVSLSESRNAENIVVPDFLTVRSDSGVLLPGLFGIVFRLALPRPCTIIAGRHRRRMNDQSLLTHSQNCTYVWF